MIDPNWTRWINASINKHFDQVATDGGTKILVPGEDPIEIRTRTAWAELSNNGPEFEPQSPEQYLVTTNIEVLCAVKGKVNIYAIQRMVGIFQAKMHPIFVFRFGENPEDDNNDLLGCLDLTPGTKIETIPWGWDSAEIPTNRTGIQGFYQMHL